jgi:diguanylate cyclase (GGDEF)-like protein
VHRIVPKITESHLSGSTFTPQQETEFRLALQRDQRSSAIICCLCAIGIWIGFAVLDLLRISNLTPGENAVEVAIIIVSRAVVLGTLFKVAVDLLRGAPRYGTRVIIAYALLGVVAATASSIAKALGTYSFDSALVAVVMAAFLPLGIRFREALCMGILVVVVCVIATFIQPQHLWLSNVQNLLTICVAFGLAAVGAFLRERADRKRFLLSQELAVQASIDPLTGLANRRSFRLSAENTLRQCVRDRRKATLTVIDIDHFKLYNDRYGHVEGDAALELVANAIRSVARRPLDLTSRIGGEEFCLLLYEVDEGQAVSRLEEILAAVTQANVDHFDSPTGKLTVSVGSATFDGSESLDMLYRRADAALYASKANGRNTFSRAEDYAQQRAARA